jgi:hypothetical protein
MPNPNLSEIITTTLRNRAPKIIDNFTNKNALLYRMKKKGNIKKTNGGRTIVKPIFYDANSTYKRYSGYEALNVNVSDVISAAEYNWKQAAVCVTISGLEKRQNSGKEAILNLLDERIKNALLTFDNNISSDIYSDGTADGGKQIGGLQSLIADTPTSGTVGGIDRATFTFWRNYSYDATTDGGAAVTSANIQRYMNRVYLATKRGSETTDLIVADDNYYLAYLESLQSIQRITNTELADAGYDNLKYMSADVIPDGGSGIPTNHMYFVNTNYVGLEYHPDAFMTASDERMSVNQDASVTPILFMGNMTLSNAARQGVLKD